MDRHWDQNTKGVGVAGSIPTGGKLFLLKLIYRSLRSNTKLTTLPTLCITGKLDSKWLEFSEDKGRSRIIVVKLARGVICRYSNTNRLIDGAVVTATTFRL